MVLKHCIAVQNTQLELKLTTDINALGPNKYT